MPEKDASDREPLERIPAAGSFNAEGATLPKRYTIEHIASAFAVTLNWQDSSRHLEAHTTYIGGDVTEPINSAEAFKRIPNVEEVAKVEWLSTCNDGSTVSIQFSQDGMSWVIRSDTPGSDAHSSLRWIQQAFADSETPPLRSYQNELILIAKVPITLLVSTLAILFVYSFSAGIVQEVREPSNADINLVMVFVPVVIALLIGTPLVIREVLRDLGSHTKHRRWLFRHSNQLRRLGRPEQISLAINIVVAIVSFLLGVAIS